MEFNEDNLDEFLENLKVEDDEKLNNIKEYSDNPSKMKVSLEKILEGNKTISSDSFLYEDFAIKKEEFDIVYATLESFLEAIGKIYNAQDFFFDTNFPTSTGHLEFMGKVITIETTFGQGVISYIRIDDIELTQNEDIPISSFSEFEKSASNILKYEYEIQEINETIKELEETINLLIPSLELNISEHLRSSLQSTIGDLGKECLLLEQKRKDLYS